MELNTIIEWLNNYLNIGDFPEDQSVNGLQVEGKEEVKSIALAVDASLNVLKEAVSRGVDLLIVHHGLLWKNALTSIQRFMGERLKMLLNSGISLYAAHLPLDAHPEVGNNITMLKVLGFPEGGNTYTERIGKIAYAVRYVADFESLVKRCERTFGRVLFTLPIEDIKRIVACSGSCSFLVYELEAGDVLLTGEMHYSAYHAALEKNIGVVELGHYATELLGIKALAEKLKEEFKLPTVVIEEKDPGL